MRGAGLSGLAKDTAVYGLGNSLSVLLYMVLVPLLTRIYTPGEYGLIELISVTVIISMAFAGLNLESALARYYYEGDADYKRTIVSTCLAGSLAFSLLTSLALVVLAPWLSSVFRMNYEAIGALRIAFLTIPGTAVLTVVLWLYRLERQAFLSVATTLSALALTLLFTIFFARYLSLGLAALFWARLLAEGLCDLSCLFLLRHRLALRFSSFCFRKMLAFSVPLILPALMLIAFAHINKYFLQIFHGPSLVAVYGVAHKVSLAVNVLIFSFRQAWLPFVFAHKEEKGAREQFASVFKDFIVFMLAAGLVVSLLARSIIGTFATGQYLDGAPLVAFLVAGMLLRALATEFVGLGILIAEKPIYSTLAFGLGGALNIILSLTLIPAYGLMGAAVAFLLGYVAVFLFMHILAEKTYPLPLNQRFTAIAYGLFFLSIFLVRSSLLAVSIKAIFMAGLVGAISLYGYRRLGELRSELFGRGRERIGLEREKLPGN